MDDCISFISSECDKVAEVLDLTPGRGIDSDLGRATKGAALALKSRVLLYAASPLYLDWQNFSESDLPSDMEKWKAAAQAAKDVMIWAYIRCMAVMPLYSRITFRIPSLF